MRLPLLLVGLLALVPALAGATPAPASPEALAASTLAAFGTPSLEAGGMDPGGERLLAGHQGGAASEPVAFLWGRKKKANKPAAPEPVLGSERARILLRSLTVPGWGQATLGRNRSATVFALAEVGVWASFASFRVQQQLRTDSYKRTARLLAGIDLNGRDEEFRRIVGSFLSSDDYNLYVVARDAANLYYDDPAAMREYIAAHELKGADTWSWSDVDGLLRFRGQRKEAQRASLRANTALALAIANRLVSAVHAARSAGHPPRAGQSWNLEIVPVDGNDATAFQLGVRTRF